MGKNRFKTNFKAILSVTFVTGSLDILLAILWYAVLQKQTTALKILQSIASGLFGMQAYRGGMRMALVGLSLHYFITLLFVSFYFVIYPTFTPLKKYPFAAGILYGLAIWMLMNLIVLPFTFRSLGTPDLSSAITGAMIVVTAISLPLSFLTNKYYQN